MSQLSSNSDQSAKKVQIPGPTTLLLYCHCLYLVHSPHRIRQGSTISFARLQPKHQSASASSPRGRGRLRAPCAETIPHRAILQPLLHVVQVARATGWRRVRRLLCLREPTSTARLPYRSFLPARENPLPLFPFQVPLHVPYVVP